MAALTAERDRWEKATEDALHAVGLWRTVALVAGIGAVSFGAMLVLGL